MIFSALRYLSLGSGTGAQQAAGPTADKPAAAADPRPTSGTAVYEVARPILQTNHAVPTKLKILLDRALASLGQEEVVMIVTGCGWNLEDYQRGYKLKVGAKIFHGLLKIFHKRQSTRHTCGVSCPSRISSLASNNILGF